MVSRGGRLSIVRVGLLVAILGIVVVVAGAIAFFADQASRQVPLEIEPYPGALAVGSEDIANTVRRRYFHVTSATPEDVAAYYNQKMAEHYGHNDEDCVRNPAAGEAVTTVPGTVPYQFVCMFDRSGFRSTQYTIVTIQPGMFNEDPARNTEGLTVVRYEQHWQAS